MLDTVFQMFTQVNRTLDRSQGGLGIGLALVRNLVELHGGSATAHSQGENQGSTFTIRLPAAVHDSEDRASIKGCSSPPTSNRSMRILVVDDNVDAADSLGMLLRSKGHDVQVVYSGAAALRAARSFQPEAIFCDVGMRGMGGMEVAAKLREDISFAPTLLIALTGWGTEADLRRTRAAGFDFHLTKPASLESVQSILSKV
jgi:CheY-like chemotaxis protein